MFDGARGNFMWMSLAFSLGHTCVTVPLALSSSLIGERANYGNAILQVATLVSGLILSVPACRSLGLKGALSMGVRLYSVYAIFFAIALCLAANGVSEGTNAAVFAVGSLLGGLGCGVMWTAQGSYFGRTVSVIAREEDQPRQQLTGQLAGTFAGVYLGLEFALKLAFSGLQLAGVEGWVIGVIYAVFSIVAAIMMSFVEDIEVEEVAKPSSLMDKAADVVRLWPNMTLWLLSPMNLLFGFSAAYMNGYFTSEYAKVEVGTRWLGLLTALTVAVGAVSSVAWRKLQETSGKYTVLVLGALSFGLIGVLSLCTNGFHGWGWWIAFAYIFQGAGRAVYESTNKAVFSDFFKGEDTESAFANCFAQNSVTGALCFFLDTLLAGEILEGIIIGLAAACPFIYALAYRQKITDEGEESKKLLA